MSVAVEECLEDAVVDTLRESGLVLDAVQLAERLSVLPSDIEAATTKLLRSGDLISLEGRFGPCYAVPHVTRHRHR